MKNRILKKSGKFLLLVIVASTLMYQQIVFAITYDVFKGRFSSGSITVVYLEGSESLCNSAYSKWNGISSKVKLAKGAGGARKIVTSFNILKPPTAGDLGLTYLMRDGAYTDTNGTWDTAICMQYANSKLDTNDKRLKTCAHEIGHAISLAHPTSNTSSIMNQGVTSNNNIQDYDKNALKLKWGN